MGFWHDHTFVICAYRESPYLEECIHSLLQQSTGSRIIMVTSTPNEYIESIARKHQILLYVNRDGGGIAQDWNFGYACANTPYVTIAHQDDIYYPNYTETMRKRVKEDDMILFSDYAEIRNEKAVYRNGNLRIKRILLFPLRFFILQKKVWIRRRVLSFGNPICCPSVFYVKKNLPEPLFLVHYRSNVDWEAWERISRNKGRFGYIHKTLMGHRIHEESETSVTIQENLRVAEDLEMFQKFWPSPVAMLLTKFYAKSEVSNKV